MIRLMTDYDRNAFLELTAKFYSSEAVDHQIPEEYHEIAFDEMLNSDLYMDGYMIEKDKKPVGYAIVSKTFSHEAGGRVLWLEELYILPEYRSEGLGKEFFDYMESNLCKNSFARIRLEISPSNSRAEKLYKSLGFNYLDYKQMVKELK